MIITDPVPLAISRSCLALVERVRIERHLRIEIIEPTPVRFFPSAIMLST
jgi:hypothetical protein